jgi:hypothetical protein
MRIKKNKSVKKVAIIIDHWVFYRSLFQTHRYHIHNIDQANQDRDLNMELFLIFSSPWTCLLRRNFVWEEEGIWDFRGLKQT